MNDINLNARRMENEIVKVINDSQLPACITCLILEKLMRSAKDQLAQIENMELENEQKSKEANVDDQSDNAAVSNQN